MSQQEFFKWKMSNKFNFKIQWVEQVEVSQNVKSLAAKPGVLSSKHGTHV